MSETVIVKTIESVLNQTYKEIEYLIVDGDSKDKTVEIAESYRESLQLRGIWHRLIKLLKSLKRQRDHLYMLVVV